MKKAIERSRVSGFLHAAGTELRNGREERVLLLGKSDLADPNLTSLWLKEFKRRGIDNCMALDMNKLESGSLKITSAAHKADTLFDATVEIIKQLAKGADVRFTTHIDIPDGLYISVDKQHLNQVVMNLLANAVKFTQAKGTVHFEAKMTETDGGVHAELAVKDTGIGMSREFTEKMYEPFSQEETGRQGTGLGLSIAKGIVDAMGGEMRCLSIEGAGTTFELELDFEKAELAPQQELADVGILNGRRELIQRHCLKSREWLQTLLTTGASALRCSADRRRANMMRYLWTCACL